MIFKYLFYKFYKFQCKIGDGMTLGFDTIGMMVLPLLLYIGSGIMLYEYFFSEIGSPFSRGTARILGVSLLVGLYVFFYFYLIYKKNLSEIMKEYEKRFEHITSFWAILLSY